MGAELGDESIKKDTEFVPFKLTDKDGHLVVKVQYREKTKKFQPEEISAFILKYIKEFATDYIGEEVTDAVITVPAYFNNFQRQATKLAGQLAGLNVLRIVNEPTAAAIAYGDRHEISDKRKILVYDLGGGTFDVLLLEVDKNDYNVLAVGGDTHLGGNNFDMLMVEYFLDEFVMKYPKQADVRNDKRAVKRLRALCESAKCRLSSALETTIELDSFYKGIDFYTKISRNKFESICDELFNKTITTVKSVLKDAELKMDNIDEIVLVGGSTRIPKIQALLTEFFDGQALSKAINPDEAVAYGAGILANELIKDSSSSSPDALKIQDVTPLSLGMDIVGGKTAVIVPRNTQIPVHHSGVFVTSRDNQTAASIKVIEGERFSTSDNTLLGVFKLENLPRRPRGETKLEVDFNIDKNGILVVTATDQSNFSNKASIKITQESNRFTQEHINKLIEDAKRYKKTDYLAKLRSESFAKLDMFLYELDKTIQKELNNPEKEEFVLSSLSNLNLKFDTKPRRLMLQKLRELVREKSKWLSSKEAINCSRRDIDSAYELVREKAFELDLADL